MCPLSRFHKCISRYCLLAYQLIGTVADVSPVVLRITSARLRADDGSEPIAIAIPGDVRAALVAAGRLDDPDRDPTDQASSWVDDRTWTYEIDLPSLTEAHVLCFAGIDTFATIAVDGVERATSTNMFRRVEVPVGPGDTTVTVRLDPPWQRIGLAHPDEFDDRRWGPRTRIRKAQFGYGWDFAPDQPSLGIWAPVTLERRAAAWLDSVRFQTLRLDRNDAVVEIDAFASGAAARARVSLRDPAGNEVLTDEAPVVDGVARVLATINAPELWWPHTLGDPALYRLEVDLLVDGAVVDHDERKVGIRTIALDESPNPDAPGRRFFRFVMNGLPFFAKGANWVPADSAVGTVDESIYRPLLEAARATNMNMLRVWGGGVYEHDAFYEICDELGLLVWQEFMFACARYHDDDQAWLDDIRAEATDQVRRLRSHACLALWCGNNEVEGIAMIQEPDLARSPGARIFNEVLPEVVAAEDGVLGYIPTSPMLGNGSDQADRHNWDVWHGLPARQNRGVAFDAPFELTPEDMSADQYLTDMSPFPSEFGLRSFPARPTLAQWIDAEHLTLDDPQITARNRDTNGPLNKVEMAASLVMGEAHTLDELIDFSQFTQAEGLKLGCEHFRRRWPSCAGTLIWQFNDCWPGPTWSLIDHAGRAKGGLAYTTRFYAPVLASFVAEADGGASLWVVNDTRTAVQDVLTVRLHRFAGTDAWTEDVAVDVPPATSQRVATWSADDLGAATDAALLVDGASIPANRLFFAPPKNLARATVKVAAEFTQLADGRAQATLRAEGYALFVHVLAEDPTVRFDDNYFDLQSGGARTITSLGPVSIDQLAMRWL